MTTPRPTQLIDDFRRMPNQCEPRTNANSRYHT
ncbi:hypothetical protein SAMN05216276_108142 [Streptosporangium subroseum]|uniref:Uncharacterized protein n=1 Tax=Streptosporangium subroseum TaxID=106412 RepID=A0A239P1R7_9ACTN|nr:hypothetical protein SAMN05216276_108142 [Streptosporangium subroseum]